MKISTFLIPCLAVLINLSCDKNAVEPEQKSEKAITAFSFALPAAQGTIDETAKTITVEVPEGTNIRSLAANFTVTGVSVTIGTVAQISGITVNDFSSPLVYTVTAEDNSTASYTVTVRVITKKITSFSFSSISAIGSIDEAKKIITVAVPGGTDVTALVAAFTTTGVIVSIGSTVQVSGVTANDFTDAVVYIVKASDGTTSSYTVTVIRSEAANWNVFDWTDTVMPPSGWQDRDNMNTYCTIADGILSFNSDSASNQAHYRYSMSPLDSGAKMTVVLKARGDGLANSLAWMVDFQSTYRGQLEIRNGQVSLQNGTSTIASVTVSASAMHTYMISYENIGSGMRINVYIDGAPTALLSGTVTVGASGTYIRLGDLSGSNTYKGSLDWIMWTTDGAFFPGGVDIPEGFSLKP
jgi:hypothetical protein